MPPHTHHMHGHRNRNHRPASEAASEPAQQASCERFRVKASVESVRNAYSDCFPIPPTPRPHPPPQLN